MKVETCRRTSVRSEPARVLAAPPSSDCGGEAVRGGGGWAAGMMAARLAEPPNSDLAGSCRWAVAKLAAPGVPFKRRACRYRGCRRWRTFGVRRR